MRATAAVNRALAFIDCNLDERLTLLAIAGVLAVSPYRLARVFKRAMGMAPHQYVIRRRMERGKELLASSDLPLADIALAVGCASQSHFCALFHRSTGTTPLSYRACKNLIYAARRRN